MNEHTALFERAAARYSEPEFSMDGLLLRRDRKQRNQRVAAGALGIAVFALAALGFARLLGSEGTPASQEQSRFEGRWISTSDADGGTQTMTISVSAEGAVEVTVTDTIATVCGGTPSTMTGTGRIEGGTALVIPSPVYACDDGSEPLALSGPPLEEQLRDWTLFLDPQTDTLTDSLGGVWRRPGADAPPPAPAPLESDQPLWPQTSMEELRQAQELADAGDPAYTWQVDPVLGPPVLGSRDHSGAEIFARFVEDELGWEASLGMTISDFGDVALIRCAPGGTNPMYPNDPEGGGCAPTIDGFRYERVQIAVAQLVRQGATGIWVVTGWETMEPFEQVTPPSGTETTALVEAFLAARIDGEGAERYVDTSPPDGDAIPFLYATPTGAPYERYELEVAEGPLWPDGRMRFEVRLFAEAGQTVVEQFFRMDRVELGLWYEDETEALDAPAGPDASEGPGTTVNGQAVPVEYDFPAGGLTLHLTYPWTGSAERSKFYLGSDEFDVLLQVLGGELPVMTGCMDAAPSDAQALARTIRSSPDLDVTPPVSVSVGGLPALWMDVSTAPGAKTCPPSVEPLLVVTDVPIFPEFRMRLYLADLPPGSSAKILTIAIGAPTDRFERAVEEAAPILDSIEFHTT